MKKFSNCSQCQKRFAIIVLSLAVVGVVLSVREVVKIVKAKNKK